MKWANEQMNVRTKKNKVEVASPLQKLRSFQAYLSNLGRFKRIDSEFRAIMTDVAKDPKVISPTNKNSLKTELKEMLDQLERCQKALSEFLEEKRLAFPRFYFIGDDDLLEILGQGSNPTVIQV